MTTPITLKEVDKTLKEMPKGKTPGIDAIPTESYQDQMVAVLEFEWHVSKVTTVSIGGCQGERAREIINQIVTLDTDSPLSFPFFYIEYHVIILFVI